MRARGAAAARLHWSFALPLLDESGRAEEAARLRSEYGMVGGMPDVGASSGGPSVEEVPDDTPSGIEPRIEEVD